MATASVQTRSGTKKRKMSEEKATATNPAAVEINQSKDKEEETKPLTIYTVCFDGVKDDGYFEVEKSFRSKLEAKVYLLAESVDFCHGGDNEMFYQWIEEGNPIDPLERRFRGTCVAACMILGATVQPTLWECIQSMKLTESEVDVMITLIEGFMKSETKSKYTIHESTLC